MDNAASIYILPALLALMVKLFLLFFARNAKSRSPVFFTMLLLFAGHNLAEVLAYIEYFKGDYSADVLRWYYVMTLCAVSATLVYVVQISNSPSSLRSISIAAVALSSGLSLFILLTDSVVSGATSIGYALTAEQGSQYWVFKLLFVGMFFLISAVLIRGYLKAKDHLAEIQCGYIFLGLLPIIIVALSVVALMSFGVNQNAAGIIPICTSFFLLITVKGELSHKLTDIRRHIPFSLERQTSSQIMDIFSRYAQ
ncbi:MAG: putative transporter, partial [Arenicella sp.]